MVRAAIIIDMSIHSWYSHAVTYVHVNSGHIRIDELGRQVLGHVPIELDVVLVPLDRVQTVALQVVVAQQRGLLADLLVDGDVGGQHPQRRAGWNTQISRSQEQKGTQALKRKKFRYVKQTKVLACIIYANGWYQTFTWVTRVEIWVWLTYRIYPLKTYVLLCSYNRGNRHGHISAGFQAVLVAIGIRTSLETFCSPSVWNPLWGSLN